MLRRPIEITALSRTNAFEDSEQAIEVIQKGTQICGKAATKSFREKC